METVGARMARSPHMPVKVLGVVGIVGAVVLDLIGAQAFIAQKAAENNWDLPVLEQVLAYVGDHLFGFAALVLLAVMFVPWRRLMGARSKSGITEEFVGRTFENETVLLDGRRFIDCTFRNCTFAWNGGQWEVRHWRREGRYRWVTAWVPAIETVNHLKALALLGDPEFASSWGPAQQGAGGETVVRVKADETSDVHLRVHRTSETGNAATEPWRRWLHLVAENWNPTPANAVRLNVRVRGEAYGGGWREWYWTEARDTVDLVEGSPVAIPIALADVAEPPAPSGVSAMLYRHQHYEVRKWFLTPQGHQGSLYDIPPGRYFLDVEAKWSEGSVTDYFMLDLPAKGEEREAAVIHIVGKERY